MPSNPSNSAGPAHPAEAPLWMPRSVPAEHYGAPGVLDLERRRVFPAGWIVVAREGALARPGQHACFDALGISLLALRDTNGQIGVFHNRCRHRASRLLDGRGRVGQVRCPYHGWCYGLDGRLAHVPGRSAFVEADLPEGLESVRSERWGGFVWVNLDGQAPPLAVFLGEVPARLAPYAVQDMVPVAESTFDLECNWKAVLDNANEPYHLRSVHRGPVGRLRPGFHLEPLGDHYEVRMTTPGSSWRRWLDAHSLPPGCTVPPAEWDTFRKMLVFPNTLINVLPHHMTVFRPVPLATNRCRVHYGFYRPRRMGALGRLRARASWALSRFVFEEDRRAMERFQRGIDSGARGPLPLHTPLEDALAHFHGRLAEKLRTAQFGEKAGSPW